MYNLHRGKTNQNPNTPQKGRRRLTPEEEAKVKEQAMLAQSMIMTFMEIKELDKKISNHCFETCLNFEEKNLESDEKECLKNCLSKIRPFMKTAQNILKEYGQNFTQMEDNLLKSEAFLKPDKFLKH